MIYCLDFSQQKFGPEHSDTLACMYSLAGLHQSQRRCRDAESLHLRYQEVGGRVFGAEHANNMLYSSSLAQV
jgi:hypothetical protein